ncbi:hypothetical protein CMUS01_13701 [Colletotrichum musicola]|uniref:Uncharacterized protein n=1 Tax=Colletotrichum musicola TaxID=2175873 RepID=A0A8H6JA99_9PEZI|nr:hypothetical protein CMUS01_13701 [Colletotrichum musicola]
MGIKQVKIQIEAANAATSSSKLPTDYAAPLLNLEATSQLQDHRRHKKYYDSLSNAAKIAGGADVEQIHNLCAFAKSATYQSQKNFLRNSRDICSAPASSNGYPWHAKSSLLLLGVILLELFHGEALEKQPSWAETLDEDGEPNEMTMFGGAFLWVSRAQRSMVNFIGEELGGALYEAIRKCTCFDFDRDDDHGDSRFAEIVYKEVVVPLEKCCPRI